MATLSRPALSDLSATVVAQTDPGAGPAFASRAPCDMLRAAIAERGGYCDWTVDHTGWVVTLHLPEEQAFSGSTLEDGLLSCLAWLVASPRRRIPSRG